jgi:hypothetical protein
MKNRYLKTPLDMDSGQIQLERLRHRELAIRFLKQSAMHLDQAFQLLKYPYFWPEFRLFLQLSAIGLIHPLSAKLAKLLRLIFSYFGFPIDKDFHDNKNTENTQPKTAVLK